MAVRATGAARDEGWLAATDAAALTVADALAALGGDPQGLTPDEVRRRRDRVGPNAVRTHRVSALAVLARQFRSALLGLLLAAATVSFFVGERTDAVVIGVILAVSVGLGFANEYRAERAGAALHDRVRHVASVVRAGRVETVDVVDLVPGDVVRIGLGQVVPADLRLVEAHRLECDESALTGESTAAVKDTAPVPPGTPPDDLASCALMGTVLRAGSGVGLVVATAGHTAFGRIAVGLGTRHGETEFQQGLRRFSLLLARVAGVLTALIFVINLVLHRPVIDAVLFSLAIAVGITPQLLPAIVTASLAAGTRALAARRVLVKRLVCVEDLGNVEVLFTDKTGTLTDGRLTLAEALGPDGRPVDTPAPPGAAGLPDAAGPLDATGPLDAADPSDAAGPGPLLAGLLANEAGPDGTDGNPLDRALWQAPAAAAQPVDAYRRVAVLPFDHERRRVSVLVDGPHGRLLVTKGAAEELLALCVDVPQQARDALDARLADGGRVVAVASRPAPDLAGLDPADERDLRLAGLLVLRDPPKADAAGAVRRLAALGVTVKVITGDHPAVAVRVCEQLGLPVTGVLTGADLAGLDDAALPAAIEQASVFARVSPEDKARLVRAQRTAGRDVAFLGDGVNDALALHAADVGISVDTGTDVARDAADVLLLDKDLDVLADGVTEGRRIFANTIKYVLMGTSSNFGNMFSAAGASAFLPFLPMLPGQILLNNLIYDLSQIAIPTDRVDADQLARPAHWDLREIRRLMLTFGPLSSLFDFLAFALLLGVLHAGPTEFRTGWFVESLATQTLVVFAIRTRASPFWRSRPSRPLLAAALAAVAVAWLIPYLPVAGPLGFGPLPPVFVPVVVALTVAYLALVELAKRTLFAASDLLRPPGPGTGTAGTQQAAAPQAGTQQAGAPQARPPEASRRRRTHRRAARFTTR
ncbi:cation-translocating P-type ATPase [Micromonospora carbonacea]|uniref:Magnesium-transporting ATPase, P-type 1 n=1 Tax=Micromonospora carbonacea TaxID=47853 RepID=A0A7H8XJJ0_9ACTN|nr:HAD-IC family P-type ATPase [Micromonospora carbonacea]MBB5828734.1 Mg2+-importing ATPase [Micromonospora carbonacea]QLD23701.1 HAD-IC family P-type ATPase [Micromonospora carbonacea]